MKNAACAQDAGIDQRFAHALPSQAMQLDYIEKNYEMARKHYVNIGPKVTSIEAGCARIEENIEQLRLQKKNARSANDLRAEREKVKVSLACISIYESRDKVTAVQAVIRAIVLYAVGPPRTALTGVVRTCVCPPSAAFREPEGPSGY